MCCDLNQHSLSYCTYKCPLCRIDEATEVFKLGISKKAVPLKRLERNYDSFKARVQERQQRGLLRKQQMEAKKQTESLRATGQRTMLGQKFDSHSRVSVPANVHAGLEARFGGNVGLGSSSSFSRSFGNSGSPSFSNTTTNTDIDSRSPAAASPSESFSVFVESTPAPTSSRSSILPIPRSSLPSTSSSTTLNSLHTSTTLSSFRRENQRPSEKFAGAIIRQSSVPTPPAAVEKFQVFQDPQETVQPSSPVAALERANSTLSMLSVCVGDDSETTSIKQRRFPVLDPTQKKKRRKDRDVQSKIIEVPEFLETRFMQRRHLYFQSKDTKGGIEYIPIPQKHDHSVSIEEFRATKCGYIEKEKQLSRKGKERAKEEAEQGLYQETDGKVLYLYVLFETSNRLYVGLSRYYKKELQEGITAPEYTTETLAAMESIGSLFKPEAHYTKEEEDLTWTNPYQRFEPVHRPPVNENE